MELTHRWIPAALGSFAISALVLPARPTVSAIDDLADDRGALLRVRVLDVASGEPIPEFRVVSGVKIAIGVEREFSERHPGEEVVNWQPHTAKLGKEGEWERPLAGAYDPLALRVEADGYVPQRHLWLEKKRGSQEVTFRLAKDPGIKGRASLPDGSPASGAIVGIALVQRNLHIEEKSFAGYGEPPAEEPGERWRRPTMVAADAEGEFTLPTETDPASAVVVVHEGGTAEMFFADFAAAPDLTLSAWGGIAGTVTVGDAPGADVEVTFGIQHNGYGYPDMVSQRGTVKTDASGAFRLAAIVPGLTQLSLFEFFPQPKEGQFRSFRRPPESAYTHVTVEAGKVTNVSLGGKDLSPLPADR